MKFKPSHKMKIEEVGDYFKKVSRGAGTIKPKKGKGSYKRRSKHRNKWE